MTSAMFSAHTTSDYLVIVFVIVAVVLAWSRFVASRRRQAGSIDASTFSTGSGFGSDTKVVVGQPMVTSFTTTIKGNDGESILNAVKDPALRQMIEQALQQGSATGAQIVPCLTVTKNGKTEPVDLKDHPLLRRMLAEALQLGANQLRSGGVMTEPPPAVQPPSGDIGAMLTTGAQPGGAFTGLQVKLSGTRSSRSAWSVLGVFLMVGIGALVITRMGHTFSTQIHGSVHASGPDLGTWTMTADTCYSGQRTQFYGVKIFQRSDHRLAVVLVDDPVRGYTIKANSTTSGNASLFFKKDCQVLNANVSQKNVVVNGIRALQGNLFFSCSSDDNRIEGNVEFDGCH